MKERYAFSGDPKEVQKLDEIAKQQERSRSAMISFLIKEEIKKRQKEENGNTTD